jgi:ATP phosphoribosyltransferase
MRPSSTPPSLVGSASSTARGGRAPITIAVPKGRVTRALAPFFERAGIDPAPLLADDRTLIRESADHGVRFLLLKPDDVPTYVEYGTAELGVSGRDVLRERRYDLYQPLDLDVGRCRMVVAGLPNATVPAVPRVATKYPRTAAEHFATLGIQAEIIYVQGSVELAPLVGLADLIVDLVESGATLRDNGLVERETIASVSSVLVANPSLYKLRHAEIAPLVERLRHAVLGTKP